MKNLIVFIFLFVFFQVISGQGVVTEIYSDTGIVFIKYPQLTLKCLAMIQKD